MRQEKMMREKCRRDALLKRAVEEKERLSKLHLITSSEELKEILSEIDEENISCTKKAQKKRAVIREQISFRKKVLRQKINIPFTKNRKQRSLTDIITELTEYLEQTH